MTVTDEDLRPNFTGYLWIISVGGLLALAAAMVSWTTKFSFFEALVIVGGGAAVVVIWFGYEWLFGVFARGDSDWSNWKAKAKKED